MANFAPTSSPLSGSTRTAVLSTIQTASSELIQRYMAYLNYTPQSSEEEVPASPTPVNRKSKRQRLAQAPKNTETLKITSRTTVKEVEHRLTLPSLWPIPKESTAIVLDLSGQSAPLNAEGKPLTVDAWLRQEDQDSWKTCTTGNRSKEGIPVPLLGGTLCRRVLQKCNGIVACSELDPALLEGYERWEMDLEKCQSLFEAQEIQRQLEPSSAKAVVAKQGSCPKPGCPGSATMVKFTLFSGQNIDLEGMECFVGKRCTQVFHPTTGLKQKNCSAQPHNHPPFPALKPNAEAKEAAAQCFLAAGGVTAKPSSVDTGPTTLALLGQPLSGKFPAFRDKRKLRDFVQSQRLEEAPLGLEWLGIINAAEEDGRLPANEHDSNSLEAFRLIWDGFFRAVESTTRHSLQFKVFHKNGNLCAIICDAEAAQAQALGEYFMKINRPTVSGIEEALPERLLLYAFKSCLFHFNQ
ncbi:hypothetical protein CALVIDRAFT_527349 [Calocera viscosa TUFC12733]|uniref:Uncharacterized protein n=1 Tax=Calocera viscosa (strain TUFC12733) TaxID=1330018 RepID=A0A167MFJ8_CALVF|nr:hypothetical protein CALVIDRAFT_527349 [Calocera viscosa TUFC12733]